MSGAPLHIVMFGDQHIATLGGAQVSMRLQRAFLEKAGHTVTVVAPAMHGPRAREMTPDAAYLDLPSIPITFDREYAMSWPGRRADAVIDRALRGRPPVDVVHVQADFWGAMLGHRYATDHGLPVVHTMHNRVDVGLRAVLSGAGAPLAGLALWVLNAWQRRALRVGAEPRPLPVGAERRALRGRAARRAIGRDGAEPGALRGRAGRRAIGHDGWAYLRRFAERSHAVTAPSAHFARRLEQHGAVPAADVVWNADRLERRPGARGVDVVWNGIDDAILDAAGACAAGRAPGVPRLIWIGRMSPEKRLLPFLAALADSGIRADVEIVGGGGQLAAARRLVRRRGLSAGPTRREGPGAARTTSGAGAATVTFAGRLPYAETLRRIAAADAVVQTSVGFETQGMTVFEAASLGTPAIVCDPDIAAELGAGVWTVGTVPTPSSDVAGAPPGASGRVSPAETGASVPALAATLRRAADDIASGTAPVPDPSIAERFRQSSRTAAMVEVYRRAIASAGRVAR